MKHLIRQVLWKLGFDIQRVNGAGQTGLGARRNSLDGVLGQVRRVGVTPGTGIDVGATFGTFTRKAARYFSMRTLCSVSRSMSAFLPSAKWQMQSLMRQMWPLLSRLKTVLYSLMGITISLDYRCTEKSRRYGHRWCSARSSRNHVGPPG